MITNPVDDDSRAVGIAYDTAKRFPAAPLGQCRTRRVNRPTSMGDGKPGSMHTYQATIYSYEDTREINTLIVGRALIGIGAFV